jgi:2-polyprenyl-6-methoxyphenol hydroxylase-like FAD-dependent oxidoreductase
MELHGMKVLISGASIAGPALGYWLAEYGFDVEIVERAAELRSGGYPIDLRGSAMQVADRVVALEEQGNALVAIDTGMWAAPFSTPLCQAPLAWFSRRSL